MKTKTATNPETGETMTFEEWRARQGEPYGECCFDYAKAWAEELEKLIEASPDVPAEQIIKENASRLSHEVDRRPGFGITGFMYGMAVSILTKTWEYGEALRRWHNLDTQIGNEGERANAEGGVLNPALLSVATK